MTDAPLLRIEQLSVAFRGDEATTRVVEDVTFDVGQGEIVGLVGESGSGKSVTAMAIIGLLGEQGSIGAGSSIRLNGRAISDLEEQEMLKIRGRDIGIVFQEPMTSLNPLMTVGYQISEALRKHLGMSTRATRTRAAELLAEVGIPDPAIRVGEYPHQLSGGMRQRVMIAMALACNPQLLIADEPTTALDVTIQAQILMLMRSLRERNGSGILLITHDLGVIAGMADRVVVMYAGQVVEIAPVGPLLTRPGHPYTKLLLSCAPTVDDPVARLPIIPGQLPAPSAWPDGCRFHTRCPLADGRCVVEAPPLRTLEGRRAIRCHHSDKVAGMPVDVASAEHGT